MADNKSTKEENDKSSRKKINIVLPKLHGFLFVIVCFMLIAWCASRVAIVYLHSETQALITQYFFFAGWCIWGVTGVFLLSAFLSAVFAVKSSNDKVHATLVWTTYLLFIGSIAYYFTAFRISAIGLHGLIAGLSNSSDKAAYLLTKFYPYFPLTPINIFASGLQKTTGLVEAIPSLRSAPLPYIILLMISFISLFIRKKNRFSIFFALLFAISGIGLTYLIGISFGDISYHIDKGLVAAAPIINYFATCLSFLMAGSIFYTTLRSMSFIKNNEKQRSNIGHPLPLSTFWLMITLVLLSPALADLENVHSLERNGQAIFDRKM